MDRIKLTGHAYGPISVQVLAELKKVDAVLNEFLDQLKFTGLDNQLHLACNSTSLNVVHIDL